MVILLLGQQRHREVCRGRVGSTVATQISGAGHGVEGLGVFGSLRGQVESS